MFCVHRSCGISPVLDYGRRDCRALEIHSLKFKARCISDPIDVATDLLYVLLFVINVVLAIVIWMD
jgi:hypothetical protein